ncbi:unnamed protein product [Nippostrongylus brasiliensis]|uniref:Lysozyme n=1 Tax=Nippostrongylus brasiliensis TaxID=27835 RepID=A0A0N4Y9Q3_NIPBR|nr:unnamed protein product [Nippostrongylus brasiliensis]
MRTLAVLLVAACSCFAGPVLQEETLKKTLSQLDVTTASAFDTYMTVTFSQFKCLKNIGFKVAFVRGYSDTQGGRVDYDVAANVQNATAAGLGAEVYMEPAPTSTKPGGTQLDELYYMLKNNNIILRSIWLKVSTPQIWTTNKNTNVAYMNSVLVRAMQYGISVGIYTSSYDWSQITGGATVNNVMLWYWNVNGQGVGGETPANYHDFSPFGGWSAPSVKQYAQDLYTCGTYINK